MTHTRFALNVLAAPALALVSMTSLFAAEPAASLDPVIRGAIDLHSHLDPDGFGPFHNGRALDVMEMAALAQAAGMRGFVIKMHYDQTADDAYLVRKQFPNLEVFGGIGTNFATGGLNPAAIRQMGDVKGGWGRVVWMPTWDAKHYVEHHGNDRPFIPVAKNGELVPEARALLATIAEVNGKTRGSKGNLIVATGHNAPEEVLLITKEARRLGLNVLVTHPLLYSVGMSIQQMQEAAKMGAYLEFVSHFTSDEKSTLEYVEAIRKIGPQYCIVSSDKGQGHGDEGHEAPAQSPVEGLSEAARVLRTHGFNDADLALMFRTNPAKILGLPVK